MALRLAFIVLFSIATFRLGNAIPAVPTQKCGANAEFRACGSACEPTCANLNPGPACTLQCVIGCFCKEGFLMNSAGECVRSNECDAAVQPIAAALHHDRRPARCAVNEEFKECKGCDSTCFGDMPCPRICKPGCACKEGHVRMNVDGDGPCVPLRQCPIIDPPVPVEVAAAAALHRDRRPARCAVNEEFKECKGCDSTCFGDMPCPRICKPGCACKEGHVRMNENGDGPCVPLRQCPIIDPPALIEVTAAVEPVDGKCAANEMFQACGSACAPTCNNPHPSPVCTRQCVIGCFCQEGFLRNHFGVCVPTRQCTPETPIAAAMPAIPQCPANEFFNPCGSACAPTCQNPNPSPVCTKECVPACFCREGLLRDERGECVQHHQCKNEAAVAAMAAPLPPPVCGLNEVMAPCHLCDASCDHPTPMCKRVLTLRMCRPGCACKEGHVRNAEGQCVPQHQCPQTTVTPFDSLVTPQPEKCGVNEEFSTCGSFCPATCAIPTPRKCTLRCKVGCFCKQGFLKNAKGVCVPTNECEQKN